MVSLSKKEATELDELLDIFLTCEKDEWFKRFSPLKIYNQCPSLQYSYDEYVLRLLDKMYELQRTKEIPVLIYGKGMINIYKDDIKSFIRLGGFAAYQAKKHPNKFWKFIKSSFETLWKSAIGKIGAWIFATILTLWILKCSSRDKSQLQHKLFPSEKVR